MNKTITICNNCGKSGHLLKQCKLPITSYGIIVYYIDDITKEYKYLMLRRKNTFGFIDFIRGKYSVYNLYQLQNIINEMTNEEKNSLLTDTFSKLWYDMWGNSSVSIYRGEEFISSKKMYTLVNGIFIGDKIIYLKDIIQHSNTFWAETEWEFPKGRKNHKEKDMDCALREFEEETGISKTKITIINNIIPFEETFIGTNYKSYKHKYYLAYMSAEDARNMNLNGFQKMEVSKLEWKTIEECIHSIRPYHLEKVNLITNIDKMLKEYPLYII
jgi:8-oxo-dGTP pyrophosphatase MutT (NUDIX family)